MKLTDALMVAAVLLAPLFALQVQIWLEHYRTYLRRQHEVFRMLMATRGSRLSLAHIEALNRIDLEFYGRRFMWVRFQTKKEKDVLACWRAYHNHLGLPAPEADAGAFNQKRWDLFVDLIYSISQECGYDFDRTHLQEMSYTPVFYGNVEADQTLIRQSLAAVLSGKQPVPVSIIVPEDALKRQSQVYDAMIAQAGDDGTLRVRVVK